LLENDPDATVPIAGALMLAPLEVLLLTPLPAIGINAHAMFRLEVVSALEMPALPFGVTCDPGRCARGSKSQPARTQ
jgi:hypothetical protein